MPTATLTCSFCGSPDLTEYPIQDGRSDYRMLYHCKRCRHFSEPEDSAPLTPQQMVEARDIRDDDYEPVEPAEWEPLLD